MIAGMVVGEIAGLWRYPVKSMQGEPVDADILGDTGLPGDRHWGLRHRESGKVMSAKRHPRLLDATARCDGTAVVVELPSGRVLEGDDPNISDELSRWLGFDVVFEEATGAAQGDYEFQLEGDESAEVLDIPCPDGTFFDFGAVHVITTSAIASMRATDPDLDWDLRRFRPTALVSTAAEGFVEDAWVGEILALGEACAYITIATPRCAIPMRAQPGLEAVPAVMRHLKREHRALLGVYGAVTLPGRVSVGDSVALT
jgi:uncharacterized protein YcbX